MQLKRASLIYLLAIIFATGCAQDNDSLKATGEMQDIYQFKVKDVEGNDFDFESLRGKKILVVNVASKCGLTPQYEDLQKLYEQYKDDNFVIVGFPANNFLWQEPGTDKEIAEFCDRKYGVTFPIMSKISVKGSDKHPVYQFLTRKDINGYKDTKVSWNFQKYMIDEEGHVVGMASPKTKPMAPEIVNWVTN